jgi:uncharacterized protein YqfA (UPF0365 family)
LIEIILENLFIYLSFAGFIFMVLYYVPVNLWITATFSGVDLKLLDLVFMKVRRSPVTEIVNSLIVATKAGLAITKEELEVHALAGGDVGAVVKTLIKAKKSDIALSMKEVTAWDLAGKHMDEELRKVQSTSNDDELKEAIIARIHQLSDDQLTEVKRLLERF